jgi:hypothetical protein
MHSVHAEKQACYVAKWKTDGSYSKVKTAKTVDRGVLKSSNVYVIHPNPDRRSSCIHRIKLSPLRVAGRKLPLEFTSKALRVHVRHSAIPQIMSKRFDRTPEQLALSEQRKAEKAKLLTTATPAMVDETKGSILARKWIQLPILSDIEMRPRVKVMTWNVSTIALHSTCLVTVHLQLLAQCLVRELHISVIKKPSTRSCRTRTLSD